MIRVLLTVCLTLMFGSYGFGGDATVLQDISDRLSTQTGLSGQFRQSKKLDFMERPLVSSGSFTLSATQGLSWLVTDPLRSEMTVRDATVMLDGVRVSDRGVGRFMAMIMEAFMAADVQGVEKDFTASGELVGERWHLLLKPKSLLLRSALSHIELSGDEFLEEISIIELNNTRTRIEFMQVIGTDVELQVRDAAGT